MRTRERFNDCWHFHRGELDYEFPKWKGPTYMQAKTERCLMGPAAIAYNSTPDCFRYKTDGIYVTEKWEYVRLPHDYIVNGEHFEGENNALGYYKYENAWYRKTFEADPADRDKRLVLEFDGVSGESTVYFNGCIMKRNFCGYTSFEVDITDFVRFGEKNVVAVHIDCRIPEGWWYEGGGIYRDVWLLKTEKLAVARDGVWARPEKISESKWNVELETELVSIEGQRCEAEVKTEIIDENGKVVSEAWGRGSIGPCDKAVIKSRAEVTDPLLWDIDSPHLYEVRTSVIRDGEVLDTHKTRIGFRTFFCDPDRGFFLNGKHVKIKGVCAHEDCGLLGKAVPANVHRYKMELLKEMGANGYRASHYQQHNAILDALDELGFIVFNEARWFSSAEDAVKQLEALVKRDRNRPSVFFWSLGNEEPLHTTESGKRITKTLMETVKRLDSSRVITTAVDKPENAPVFDELDMIGINYNLDVFDSTHEKYPNTPIVSSENSAAASTRGWYYDNCPQKGYFSAYDRDFNHYFLNREYTWKYIAQRDFVLGGYQWIAFEHRGETVWPRVCSQSGAIDLFLQKKDAFYQNQSHWLESPMIHMLPHWNVDVSEGDTVRVWAYTNCEEAELFLNGRSLGRQRAEKYTHLEWLVPYEKGYVEMVGYNGGKEAARDTHRTAGAPKKLILRLDNKVNDIDDVAIVTCYTVDSEGNFVPNASPTVEFFTNSFGKILGTGSDISDRAPLNALTRKMYEGYVSAAVGIELFKGLPVQQSGTVTVYAKAEGLESARLDIVMNDRSAENREIVK